jgi:hypothetical protein
MTKEQLLGEVEDLLRTMPPPETMHHDENLSWLGRLSAVIEEWKPSKATLLLAYTTQFHATDGMTRRQGKRNLITLLQQARHDLRMETVGPLSVAVSQGMVFDYFDEMRKIVELAKQDLFFVDPYLDAEFVSRYLVYVTDGITIRLLTRYKLLTLIPAVNAFCQQSNRKVEVRSAQNLHDRFVFVDKIACYQSGASFKDGAKSAPTTLTQITDAFQAMLQTYEKLWNDAKLVP